MNEIEKLKAERDAALAKLAAMEQQEPVAFRISDPNDPEIGFWFGEDPASDWLVSEPLYAYPVAQAGQVPDHAAFLDWAEKVLNNEQQRLSADGYLMDSDDCIQVLREAAAPQPAKGDGSDE